MKKEIYEIPYRAELCYLKNKGIILPELVPYIGMGSSYMATLAFKYLGVRIFPELASEYHYYLQQNYSVENGVLISQSGQSSETLKCAERFKSFVCIVNDENSPLGKHEKCSKVVNIHAGNELLLPTKTFINTLLVLYLGLGFNPEPAISVLKSKAHIFEETGIELGKLLLKQMKKKGLKGIYVISCGSNVATAHHAALVLSEISRIPVISLPVSQFDHGFKETSKNSLVIAINHKDSAENNYITKVLSTVKNAGGSTVEINQSFSEEKLGPLVFPMYFFFAAEFLSRKLKIKNPFEVGEKITKTFL